MYVLEIVFSLLVAWILYKLWRVLTDPCKIPGPWGLPLIGYIPFLGSRPHETITKLANKYGNIFQMRIGGQRVVVISGLELIKEVGGKRQLAHRHLLPPFKAIAEFVGSSFAFQHYTERTYFLRKAAVRAMGYFVNSESNQLEQYTLAALQAMCTDFEKAEEDAQRKSAGKEDNIRTTVFLRIA